MHLKPNATEIKILEYQLKVIEEAKEVYRLREGAIREELQRLYNRREKLTPRKTSSPGVKV